jgi:hypothetical protein
MCNKNRKRKSPKITPWMLASLYSLDAENVIGHVKSLCLHQTYDMVKLCLTIGMDESIYVVCDILVPISFLHKYFHNELSLVFMKRNYNFLDTSHQFV